MPGTATETVSALKKSAQVTLDANGDGILTWDPDNASQRWVISAVTVSTNQASGSTPVPVAVIALNAADPAAVSAGNVRATTPNGNLDTLWGRSIEVGPCDFLSVAFTGGVPGSMASAVITGTKHTRRR